MTNWEKYFGDADSAAEFLASVCTCFTCPVQAGSVEHCGRATCADSLREWMDDSDDD